MSKRLKHITNRFHDLPKPPVPNVNFTPDLVPPPKQPTPSFPSWHPGHFADKASETPESRFTLHDIAAFLNGNAVVLRVIASELENEQDKVDLMWLAERMKAVGRRTFKIANELDPTAKDVRRQKQSKGLEQ